jgi:hypothetical protein
MSLMAVCSISTEHIHIKLNFRHPLINKLAARGLEEHMRVSLIFAIIVSFMLFTVFTLVYVDSRGFMILKNNWPNLLICRPVQTDDGRTDGRIDERTDELIRVGPGNLSVPPG